MTNQPRWWDVATGATLLVCAGIVVGGSSAGPLWGAWIVLALFALAYAVLGRSLIVRRRMPQTLIYCALMVVLSGAAAFFSPALATVQCIVYSLVWCVVDRYRLAILTSTAVAAAIFVGSALTALADGDPATMPSGDDVATAGAIAVLSLAFAIALGTWISRIADFAEERARLLAELTAAQSELAAMHREAGVTSERARLAREIHDTIAQSLTGLVMLAERAGWELRRGDEATTQTVAMIESMARDALAETRALVATTTPVRVDSTLADALSRVAARFERETGIAVATAVCEKRLARETEVVLLRCAQEGLANVRKHSRARRVTIEVTADASGVVLAIADDGIGIAPGALSDDPGFGVAGMRERVADLGGTLSLGSGPQGGAVLRIGLPTRPGRGADADRPDRTGSLGRAGAGDGTSARRIEGAGAAGAA